MEINTARFGSLEVSDEQIIVFPEGILGFEEYQRYVIVDNKDSYFKFLQSVEQPELAFVVIAPEILRSSYSVVLDQHQVAGLELTDASDGQVFAIVTIPDNLADMTANLQAPVVINTKKSVGKQIVLMDGQYHTRHNVLAEMQQNAFQQKQDQQRLRKTV